jgi:PAS domain S-box-containing protein
MDLVLKNLCDSIFKSAIDAIIVINHIGIIEAFSPSAERLFGYSEDMVVGQNVSILMPQKTAAEHDGYLDNYKRTDHAKIIGIGREVVGKKRNGQEFRMHLSVGKAEGDEGDLKFVGICHDMTPYYLVKNYLNETMENYENLSNYEGLYIASIDNNGYVTKSNKLFLESGFVDSNNMIVNFSSHFTFENAIKKTLEDGFFSISKLVVKIENDARVIDWNFKLIANENIQIIGIDCTESEEKSISLLNAKTHDPFTDIPNVNYLHFLFNSEGFNLSDYYFFRIIFENIEIKKRLSNATSINKIVRNIYELIEGVVEHSIQLNDYSFLNLLRKRDFPDAVDLEKTISKIAFLINKSDSIKNKKITFGFCDYHNDGVNNGVDEILRRTEFSLRHAIHNNTIMSFYDASVEDSINRIKYIETNVINLIDDEVVLYFQPKIRSSDTSVYGYEALMRWNSPVIGWVSPPEIIHAVDNLGLMDVVDKKIIIKAFKAISENAQLQKKSISINISPTSINSNFVVDLIEKNAKKYSIDLNYIDIEITEDSLLENHGNALSNIDALRNKGLTISLDDFGKGYSSLSYLTSFNMDYLKIDKLFIDNLGTYRGDGMVESIIKMAHINDMKVVAEGVEDKQQVMILKSMNCDLFQGYYFGKPADVNNLRDKK